MLITSKTMAGQMTVKRNDLGLSALQLAKLLGVPSEGVYKWEKGTVPRDNVIYNRLENFIRGEYDFLVKNGKVVKSYPDYLASIETKPTNDFYDNQNIAAEPEEQYKTAKDELIDNQRQQIEDLRIDKQRLIDENDYLKFKVIELEEKLKTPVIRTGKTGSSRNSG